MRIGLRLFSFGPLSAYTTLWRSKPPYWTHPGCGIRHQRKDTADRCGQRTSRTG